MKEKMYSSEEIKKELMTVFENLAIQIKGNRKLAQFAVAKYQEYQQQTVMEIAERLKIDMVLRNEK